MALQSASPATTPAPHVVGNAFVQQYYHVLLTQPDMVHRFYQDSSILTSPDSDGVRTSAINDKLLSNNFSTLEIESIDSQASYHNGVIIVVTGCLMGSDKVRWKFTQSFFLAPQENGGFFVLNDIFRFLDQPIESNQILANGINETPNSPLSPSAGEPNLVQENHVDNLTATPSETDLVNHVDNLTTTPSEADLVNHVDNLTATPPEADLVNHEEVINPSENDSSGIEEEVAVELPVQNQSDELPVQEVATSVAQEDGHKKSYASIVKDKKVITPQKSASVPAKAKAKVKAPLNVEKPLNVPTVPASIPETRNSSNNNAPEKISSQDVEGHSIYVRNLPLNATAEQVEEELKKFGSIKPGGVQVRNHKIDRFCFGFVEFESVTSMQDAIQASPIIMGGRQVFIEEKRTTTRVVNGVVISNGNGNGRGRFPPGRGGFRNDSFRGCNLNFMGQNQGFGRAEIRNRGEFGGRGRGRVGEGYQLRAIQNGNGRIGRPIAMNQTASIST